jgi:hypothetical protein
MFRAHLPKSFVAGSKIGAVKFHPGFGNAMLQCSYSSCPEHTEVDTYCHTYCHQIMAWRHELLRKWAGGKRHDLEAVRRIFMTSEASSRAVLLGSGMDGQSAC